MLLALACAVPASADASSLPAGFKPFAPDSIWNQPVARDAALHPESAAWTSWLNASVAERGAWINTSTCSMPIYWAGADTPRVPVALDHPSYMDPAMIRAWSSVPIPAGATPANCSDKNFAVLQRQPDGRIHSWEFWQATKRTDGTWVAKWGGASTDVMADRGIASSLTWTDPLAPSIQSSASAWSWNVTGSSVSMYAGVITLDELARGSIDHAVSMATFDAAVGRWLWPAQRTDGSSTDPGAIPEGAHLRLDPDLDIEALPLTPLVKMIARAAQKYGIVVRDKTRWNTVFYVQQPPPGSAHPLTPLLAGKTLDKALQAFPWSRLQVLDAPTCTAPFGCSATPRAVIDVRTQSPTEDSPVTLDTSRSWLDHPRTRVEWDLDGDGAYETPAGAAVQHTFTPSTGGDRRVGVRITTRDGLVTTGSKLLQIARVAAAAPVTVRPQSVSTRYFYPFSSGYTSLTSVNATTEAPLQPDSGRKLYGSQSGASATVNLTSGASAEGSRIRGYVECSRTRCLRLTAVGASGEVLGQSDVPYGFRGWTTLALERGSAGGLTLKATVKSTTPATGNATIAAVSASVVR